MGQGEGWGWGAKNREGWEGVQNGSVISPLKTGLKARNLGGKQEWAVERKL